KCHQPDTCGERPRLPAAVRDDCVGCHMPPRVWMNVHFHTEDDQYFPPIRRCQHRIAVDPVARQEVLLAWHRAQPGEDSRREAARLTGELVAHWLAEADRCRRDYRFLAAIGCAREALQLEPTKATRARLQEVVAVALKLDAELSEGLRRMEERRYPEAIATFQRILDVKPNWAVAHGKLGAVYAAVGQSGPAVEHLRAVARYDPD